MRYHRGPPIQQGAGLGSIFSGLFRTLLPVAKGAVKTIGKIAKSSTAKSAGRLIKDQVKQAAVNTALDALEGKSIGSSAKSRLKTASKNILHATQYMGKNDNLRKKTSSKRKRKVKQPLVKVKRRRIQQQRREPLFDDYYEEEDDSY